MQMRHMAYIEYYPLDWHEGKDLQLAEDIHRFTRATSRRREESNSPTFIRTVKLEFLTLLTRL